MKEVWNSIWQKAWQVARSRAGTASTRRHTPNSGKELTAGTTSDNIARLSCVIYKFIRVYTRSTGWMRPCRRDLSAVNVLPERRRTRPFLLRHRKHRIRIELLTRTIPKPATVFGDVRNTREAEGSFGKAIGSAPEPWNFRAFVFRHSDGTRRPR